MDGRGGRSRKTQLQPGRVHPHPGRHHGIDNPVGIRPGFDLQVVHRRTDLFRRDVELLEADELLRFRIDRSHKVGCGPVSADKARVLADQAGPGFRSRPTASRTRCRAIGRVRGA